MAELTPKPKPTAPAPITVEDRSNNTSTIPNTVNTVKPTSVPKTPVSAMRRPGAMTLPEMNDWSASMIGSKIGERVDEPVQAKTGNTWTSISADCDLLTWPIPIMLNMTDLASSLQTYCSAWMDLYQLRSLQDDMNAMAAELMSEHLYLYVDARRVNGLDRKGRARASVWSVSWWKSLFDFGKRTDDNDKDDAAATVDTNTSRNDAVDSSSSSSSSSTNTNASTTTAEQTYGTTARQHFDDREYTRLVKQFERAYSIVQRWNTVCAVLAANRERALSTQIFQCAWKSGLNQHDYVDTALPLHSVMWTVTCVALAFNLGRRCEVLRSNSFKACYENAFRLLYHVAYDELCSWTNHESSDISDCPPEARIETCTAYMRMCLMKMQICTIQHVEFRTINQLESTESTNIANARNMFRLALYLEWQVTSMLPAEHSFVNTTYRASSLYQPGSYVMLSLARIAEYYTLVAKAYQSLASLHFYHYTNVSLQASPSANDSQVRDKVMIQHRACAKAAVECIALCNALIKFLSSNTLGESGMARIVFEQFWIPYVFRYWLLVVRPKFEQKRNDVWTFPTTTADDDDDDSSNRLVGLDNDGSNAGYSVQQVHALTVRFDDSIKISMRDTAAVGNIIPAVVSGEPCMYLNTPGVVEERLFSLSNGLLQSLAAKK